MTAVPPSPLPVDALHALARESLAAPTGAQADACDARLSALLQGLLAAGDGQGLAQALDAAPSPDLHRHLWRILARLERSGGAVTRGSPVRLFAMPVVVVAALSAAGAADCELPGVLADPRELAQLLVEHGALAGNATIALAPALVDANALELVRLPSLLAAGGTGPVAGGLDLAPVPLAVAGTTESVHLRFIVGTALAAPTADLFRERDAGKWAMPFAQRLSTQLAVADTSVLAMARPPQPLVEALWSGRLAQREVAAQLFVSNALRDLRARVGEPVAVISLHRGPPGAATGDAPAEVRLSLSSPFEPRDAQGLRCPLWPLDRPEDVAAMLATLLADCRVRDVRREPGVHADRDPVSGGPLLFKAGQDSAAAVRH